MKDEYNSSILIFKNLKNLLIKKSNSPEISLEMLNNIINQICLLDNKIKEYENLIEEENNKQTKISIINQKDKSKNADLKKINKNIRIKDNNLEQETEIENNSHK